MFAAEAMPCWLGRGAFAEGSNYLAKALALPTAREPTGQRAAALLALGHLTWRQGKKQQAAALLENARDIYTQLGDTGGIAHCNLRLSEVAGERVDHDRTYIQFGEPGALLHGAVTAPLIGIDDNQVDAFDDNRSAESLAWCNRDLPSARQIGNEASGVPRHKSHDCTTADALDSMGKSALDRNDLTSARVYFSESLALWRKLGDTEHTASTLESMAILARLDKDTP